MAWGLSTQTCLFVSRAGYLSVKFLEKPVPESWDIEIVPPGMAHAARLLGIPPMRTFKRTTSDGPVPVFEEA
jgi:hypothetical protein